MEFWWAILSPWTGKLAAPDRCLHSLAAPHWLCHTTLRPETNANNSKLSAGMCQPERQTKSSSGRNGHNLRTGGISRRAGGVIWKPSQLQISASATIPFKTKTPEDLLRRPSNDQQRAPHLARSNCNLEQQKYPDSLHARRWSISGELHAGYAKIY